MLFLMAKIHTTQVLSNWYSDGLIPVILPLAMRCEFTTHGNLWGEHQNGKNYYKTEGQVLQKLKYVTYVVQAKGWKSPKIIHAGKLKPSLHFQ